MAMVLYEGRSIAFGPRNAVFERMAQLSGRQAPRTNHAEPVFQGAGP